MPQLSDPQAPNVIRPSKQREHEAPQTPAEPPRSAHSEGIPAQVRERFVQVRDHYYFTTGELAFRDHGAKLSTRSENAELVRSLVQIAQTRGWDEITVSGTERFRKQVWREATALGVGVRGYEPSDFERARVIRAMAREGGREAPAASLARASETPAVQTAAVSEEAQDRSRDAAARVFRDRKIDPQRGTQSHPKLLNGYLSQHAAKQFAQRRIAGPEDQRKFVELVREAIADSVARGQRLPSVRLRDRKATRDREAARVRSIEREPHPIPS
jgi:Large polyvalent protein-associated domain 7